MRVFGVNALCSMESWLWRLLGGFVLITYPVWVILDRVFLHAPWADCVCGIARDGFVLLMTGNTDEV